VEAVDSGAAALVSAQREAPDVILLDWMMPGLDGPETCERLKANPATSSIPVIFLTAKTQDAEISRGLALGARGYIPKPFDALALGRQVRDILQS
jgi:CheY-like chemotaxis protein